jgi:hypothetical protein
LTDLRTHPHPSWLVSLNPKAAGYESNRIHGFWRVRLERIKHIPGVQRVSLAGMVPMAGGRQRQPWTNPSSGEKIEIDTNFVVPLYFQTLAIPVLSGRDFTDDDVRASRPVVIVNERLARAFWPQQDTIGKGVRVPESGNPTAEVVGVVRDVKYRDLRGAARWNIRRTSAGAELYRRLRGYGTRCETANS